MSSFFKQRINSNIIGDERQPTTSDTAEKSMFDFMTKNPLFITQDNQWLDFVGGPMETEENYYPHTSQTKLWDKQVDVLDMIKLRNEWMGAGSPYIDQDKDIDRASYSEGVPMGDNPFSNSLLGGWLLNTPTAVDTAHVYPGNVDDLIAELSHGYDAGSGSRELIRTMGKFSLDNLRYGGHDKTYNKPGTIEHTAHSIVEPQIMERLGYSSIWNLGHDRVE